MTPGTPSLTVTGFGDVMSTEYNLLAEHSARCIQLAYQCRNAKAERLLRRLGVDLMLSAQQQRSKLASLLAELQPPAETPAPPKPTATLRPEMLRELEALRLVVRADPLPV